MFLAALAAGKGQDPVDIELKKVERRVYGADEDIRNACKERLVSIDDRERETDGPLEVRRSDVRIEGAIASDLRACVRAIAKAGVIEGWKLGPADRAHRLEIRLVRVRRNPKDERTTKSDREAAEKIGALWADRRPVPEVLAPELIAPDLVILDAAAWNAGSISIEARAFDARFAAGYERLITPLVAAGPKVEWRLTSRHGMPARPPPIAEEGTLRAALRDAKPAAILRLFAKLDRRDFVMPAGIGAPRTGAVGGGWLGILGKLSAELGRTHVQVGAIDVLAPKGTRDPKPGFWSGKKVVFELEDVPSSAIYALLSAASGFEITGPPLPRTDLQLRAMPWDQALLAVAIAHGCTVVEPYAEARELRCAQAYDREPEPVPPSAVDEASPLERFPACDLRVVAFGRRESGKAWRAIVADPAGHHVLVQTGTSMGLDRGRAVVDEKGVSIVLERHDTIGNVILSATPLAF